MRHVAMNYIEDPNVWAPIILLFLEAYFGLVALKYERLIKMDENE